MQFASGWWKQAVLGRRGCNMKRFLPLFCFFLACVHPNLAHYKSRDQPKGTESATKSSDSSNASAPMVAPAPPKPPAMPEAVEVEEAREESEPGAEGTALGDLFEYKLKERVTIRKNQSALVPILQTDVAAEKVSLWSESLGVARPLRALWLTNASALTLDGGSFNVLDSNTFAGEGLLEAIKPGDRRLLSYATDLGLLVDAKDESTKERVTRVLITHGTMATISEEREKKIYIVRNEDTTPRTLIIE